ncbi:MAG TPA: YbaB/EbfC family nucleoid-associated protein [Acidimicrobiales bacterium]|nr:YbaB/EbfC family nucleoid-associated protein [Acidimicrobiales bacterium]
MSDLEPTDGQTEDEGGPPGLDLGALLGGVQEMQQQLLDAQAEVAAQVVEGQSGGGVVRIEVTGAWEFRSVTIGPDAGSDPEELGDLVLAALRDAARQVGELQESLGEAVDLPDLGGLLGG